VLGSQNDSGSYQCSNESLSSPILPQCPGRALPGRQSDPIDEIEGWLLQLEAVEGTATGESLDRSLTHDKAELIEAYQIRDGIVLEFCDEGGLTDPCPTEDSGGVVTCADKAIPERDRAIVLTPTAMIHEHLEQVPLVASQRWPRHDAPLSPPTTSTYPIVLILPGFTSTATSWPPQPHPDAP